VLAPLGDIWWIGSLDSALCAAVAAQGESQRFLRLADAFDASPPVPDRQALIRGSLLRSRALLLRGLAADAEAAARRGVELADPTDLMSDQADALNTLAEALDARGLADEAMAARANAVALLRAKGHELAAATLARSVGADLRGDRRTQRAP
jgi:hypothetical protein